MLTAGASLTDGFPSEKVSSLLPLALLPELAVPVEKPTRIWHLWTLIWVWTDCGSGFGFSQADAGWVWSSCFELSSGSGCSSG